MGTADTSVAILFVVASMAGVGLHARASDIFAAVRDRRLLLAAVVVNLLVIPLMGWALVWAVDLPSNAGKALLLLACTPGGPSALQFTSKQSGAWARAGAVAVWLSLLSVLVSPLLMGGIAPPEVSLVVPYTRLFWWFVLLLVLPMVGGMMFRRFWPGKAVTVSKAMTWLGTVAFVGFVVMTLSERRAATGSLTAGSMLTMLGFILLCMAVGWLMGGPGRETRRVLAAASSMRNVAVCLAIVTQSFPGLDVRVPLVAFSALMIPPNMLFFVGTRVRDWRARRKEAGDVSRH